MRRGHAGAGDGVGGRGTADPGGDDADARAEDVDDGAKVGEGSPVVVDVGGADSADGRCGSGRHVASVDAVVASCHGYEDAGVHSGLVGLSVEDAPQKQYIGSTYRHGIIRRLAVVAAEAHIDHGASGAAVGAGI